MVGWVAVEDLLCDLERVWEKVADTECVFTAMESAAGGTWINTPCERETGSVGCMRVAICSDGNVGGRVVADLF